MKKIKQYRNRFLFQRDDGDFEVVKYKNGEYPTDEDFGIGLYGVYLSKKQIDLNERIEFYLKNGFKKRYDK